ncbi:hypothetical protein [Coleofasciculus sp. G2-EDA-02]|uniref:hypothetical protein n=1 Tax=Coleofasciculus sp. G2-EDA-02 TaxID=3069529 RepID=UPI0032FEFECC
MIASDYDWKLTIIERNLSHSNWINLLPEAQERILEEADDLLNVLPFPHKQRLKTSLERIRDCTNLKELALN